MSNFTKTTLPEPIIGISGPDNTPNPKRPGLTCIHEAKLLMEKLQKYGGRERTPSEWYSSMSFSAGRIIDMIVKMKRQVKLIGEETEKKLEETGVTIFNAAQKALAERSENGTYVLAEQSHRGFRQGMLKTGLSRNFEGCFPATLSPAAYVFV